MIGRIYASANPTRDFARLQPMSREDARFWQLRRGEQPARGWMPKLFRRSK